MTLKLYILVVAAWMGWTGVQATEYCWITPEHTMCKYYGRGPTCGPEVGGGGVSSEDAAAIVNVHNELRAKVAREGEMRGAPGPQPSGANIRVLEWDEELAAVAQRLADQCVFNHDCSACRRVDRFSVGQNLYISSHSDHSQTGPNWYAAVKKWYDEVALFPNSNTENFVPTSSTGHYSQMLWAETSLVGCGYTTFVQGGWLNKLYACNYGPAGNMRGGSMYNVGPPCFACPPGTSCSRQYWGLCGRN